MTTRHKNSGKWLLSRFASTASLDSRLQLSRYFNPNVINPRAGNPPAALREQWSEATLRSGCAPQRGDLTGNDAPLHLLTLITIYSEDLHMSSG